MPLPSGVRALALDHHGAWIPARLALVGSQRRTELAPLVWPDASAVRARANLRQRLLRLEALAGTVLLSLAAHGAVLPTDPADAGELLAGVQAAFAVGMQHCLETTRRSFCQRRLQALAAQASNAEADRRVPDALAVLQQMVALEPDAEAHRRELMRLHCLNHDRAAARTAYAKLHEMLQGHFGMAPSAETTALLYLIDRSDAPGQRYSVSTATTSALACPSSLVGRDPGRRCRAGQIAAGRTTLVLGEAGMGKTRLLGHLPAAGAAPMHSVHEARDRPWLPDIEPAACPVASCGKLWQVVASQCRGRRCQSPARQTRSGTWHCGQLQARRIDVITAL